MVMVLVLTVMVFVTLLFLLLLTLVIIVVSSVVARMILVPRRGSVMLVAVGPLRRRLLGRRP